MKKAKKSKSKAKRAAPSIATVAQRQAAMMREDIENVRYKIPAPAPTTIQLTNVSSHTPAEAMALAAKLFVLATNAGATRAEWIAAIAAASQPAASAAEVQ